MKKFHQKKAQGLSINTIIIAALGLAVLVILFAVFTGRIGLFNQGVAGADTCQQKCTALGSSVMRATTATECGERSGSYVAGVYKDVSTGEVCCCRSS